MSEIRASSGNAGAEPPTSARRLDYIDGLRALAALWVAVHHVIETSIPRRALDSSLGGPILGTLFFGQFPVMVFLMLSGFCLYYPYVRKNPDAPVFNTGYWVYLRRRWVRIAPPYMAAGVLCLAMTFFFPELDTGRWKIVGPVTGPIILSHLVFAHNLILSHATKIDYPMWSIGLEWQLYLFFPLLIWAFRRRGPLLTIGVTLAVATIIRATYRHMPPLLGTALRDGPLAYLMIFAIGMVAASLTVKQWVLPLRKWQAGVLVVAGLAAVRFGSGNGLVHDLATTGAFFIVLLMAAHPESRTSRILSVGWLVRLGVFSYSLYLIHAPLVHLAWFALDHFGFDADAIFWSVTFLGMPIIIGLSYVFHLAFERPFMRVKPSHAPAKAAEQKPVPVI